MQNNSNSVTLLFSIKNINNLFIYKDHWTDNKIMRLVIKEIINSGQFETEYLGGNHRPIFDNLIEKSANSAIISVTIRDLQITEIAPSAIISIFAEELCNRKNRFLFENNMLDESRNLTNINISIQLNNLRRQLLSVNQAA